MPVDGEVPVVDRVLPPRASTRAGFTLIEILVTVAIMGLMLAAITQMLSSVRFTRDIIHNEQEQYLAGPAIMDLIERDLQAVFVTGLRRADHLKVEDRVLGGTDADRLDFFTSTDSLLWQEEGDRQIRADVNEVGYCLRVNPEEEDFLELYRREGFGIDLEPHRGGNYIFLHDRVRAFDIEVFAARGPEDELEALEEWGQTEDDPEISGLPAFLRITLEIELEPRLLRETLLRSKQLKTYVRIINLPESLRFENENDVPRLQIPTGATSQDEPATGPGGEGEGDGEGEGEGQGEGDNRGPDDSLERTEGSGDGE